MEALSSSLKVSLFHESMVLNVITICELSIVLRRAKPLMMLELLMLAVVSLMSQLYYHILNFLVLFWALTYFLSLSFV